MNFNFLFPELRELQIVSAVFAGVNFQYVDLVDDYKRYSFYKKPLLKFFLKFLQKTGLSV